MLPVVIASAEGEVLLHPYDLRTKLKPAGYQSISHDTAEHGCVPHIGDVAREKGVSLAPIRPVVVLNLARTAKLLPLAALKVLVAP